MDPVTHMTLGAAVGHFVGGRRLGWVAPVAGAAIAILPDLDVFWPAAGAGGGILTRYIAGSRIRCSSHPSSAD